LEGEIEIILETVKRENPQKPLQTERLQKGKTWKISDSNIGKPEKT